jgi:uncharacterized protein YggL (DUF469 family)
LDGLKTLTKLQGVCRTNYLKALDHKEEEYLAWLKDRKIVSMGNLCDGYWDSFDVFYDT